LLSTPFVGKTIFGCFRIDGFSYAFFIGTPSYRLTATPPG
jgi:hypothetical protein